MSSKKNILGLMLLMGAAFNGVMGAQTVKVVKAKDILAESNMMEKIQKLINKQLIKTIELGSNDILEKGKIGLVTIGSNKQYKAQTVSTHEHTITGEEVLKIYNYIAVVETGVQLIYDILCSNLDGSKFGLGTDAPTAKTAVENALKTETDFNTLLDKIKFFDAATTTLKFNQTETGAFLQKYLSVKDYVEIVKANEADAWISNMQGALKKDHNSAKGLIHFFKKYGEVHTKDPKTASEFENKNAKENFVAILKDDTAFVLESEHKQALADAKTPAAGGNSGATGGNQGATVGNQGAATGFDLTNVKKVTEVESFIKNTKDGIKTKIEDLKKEKTPTEAQKEELKALQSVNNLQIVNPMMDILVKVGGPVLGVAAGFGVAKVMGGSSSEQGTQTEEQKTDEKE